MTTVTPQWQEQRKAKSEQRYYYPVREKVLRYIRDQALLCAGGRVAVAVSGGADSVALLRVLLNLRDELGLVLVVAHFNHGLRGEESAADEAFVRQLALQHRLPCFAGHANVREHALTAKLSLEAAGRQLRYRWFAQIAAKHRCDSVATAHTLDDQAETVVLKFLRGAGTKGLAGIYPLVQIGRRGAEAPPVVVSPNAAPEGAPLQDASASSTAARIVRPLLCASRQEVEAYLTALGQSWREDTTNLDRRFLRNRVRHQLLPLLERAYNPNIRQALSDLAELSRGDEDYWQRETERHLSAVNLAAQPLRMQLDTFGELPPALQRRVLKRFGEQAGIAFDFAHIEKLRRCALGALPRTELPGGWLALRRKQSLELCRPSSAAAPPTAYELVLPIPGEAQIPPPGFTLRAQLVREAFARELPPEELLAADLLGSELLVRNWRPGDRFHPAHSRNQEKLKRLFAEKRIAEEQRARWPLALCGTEIVWVRGFPVAKAYRWNGTGDAVRIEAVTLEG